MGYKLTNNKTIVVDKIVVGTPVRTVQAAGIPGVNATGAVEGDVLVYNGTLGLWQASSVLNVATFDGGDY
jgi:hypothetical protein